MSNDARLLVSNQNGTPETDQDLDAERKEDYVNTPFLESHYTVPVFWVALFGPDNVATYYDPDDETDVPFLIDSVVNVRERFEQRLPIIQKMFSNIDTYVATWQKLLDGIDHEFIKIQLFEILEMTEDGYGLLVPAISYLQEPNEESLLAFMQLTDFPLVLDPGTNTVIELDHENGKTTEDCLFGFDPWKSNS